MPRKIWYQEKAEDEEASENGKRQRERKREWKKKEIFCICAVPDLRLQWNLVKWQRNNATNPSRFINVRQITFHLSSAHSSIFARCKLLNWYTLYTLLHAFVFTFEWVCLCLILNLYCTIYQTVLFFAIDSQPLFFLFFIFSLLIRFIASDYMHTAGTWQTK